MGFTRHLIYVLLLLPPLPAVAQADAAGFVLLTRGTVTALDANGNTRTLSRRAELYAGDRITTGDAGFAQIRMVDNAIIALKENTEFAIHEYAYDGDGGSPDRAIMALLSGGLRTITGLIGSGDTDVYRLDTQAATLGGGNTYECVIATGKLHCGVFSGSITLTSSQGTVVLGLGGNQDFAEADSATGVITPLYSMPSVLGGITVQQNPNATVQAQRTPYTVTPLTNGVTFPEPAPIRVIPYRNPTP